MKKIDLLRPHGRIIGQCTVCPGAFYSQDECFFDARGYLITDEGTSDGLQRYEKRNEEGPNVKINDDGERQERQEENEERDDEVKPFEPVSEPVSVPVSESKPVPKMTLTNKELNAIAEKGIYALRDAAEPYGVNGRSKKEIVDELKALRE